MMEYLNPEWAMTTKVHDWRNHVPFEIRSIWETFSMDQRKALYEWANCLASMEEWD